MGQRGWGRPASSHLPVKIERSRILTKSGSNLWRPGHRDFIGAQFKVEHVGSRSQSVWGFTDLGDHDITELYMSPNQRPCRCFVAGDGDGVAPCDARCRGALRVNLSGGGQRRCVEDGRMAAAHPARGCNRGPDSATGLPRTVGRRARRTRRPRAGFPVHCGLPRGLSGSSSCRARRRLPNDRRPARRGKTRLV